jgi:hypothetical protein
MLSDSQRAAAAARAARADAARPAIAARAERRAGQADEAPAQPQALPERTPLPPPLAGRECTWPDGCGFARLMDPTTGEPVDGIDRCGLHLR